MLQNPLQVLHFAAECKGTLHDRQSGKGNLAWSAYHVELDICLGRKLPELAELPCLVHVRNLQLHSHDAVSFHAYG